MMKQKLKDTIKLMTPKTRKLVLQKKQTFSQAHSEENRIRNKRVREATSISGTQISEQLYASKFSNLEETEKFLELYKHLRLNREEKKT